MTEVMGEYEATLRRRAMQARARLMGAAVKPPVVKVEPLRHFVDPVFPPLDLSKRPGASVIREVAEKHGVSPRDLKGRDSRRCMTKIRHEAAFRLVIELKFSYPQAGRALGGRDHTTILNSIRRHAQTSPEAMQAYQRHHKAETRRKNAKRAKAIRMHFDDGIPLGRVSGLMSVPPTTLTRWMLEEYERRRAGE